MSGVGGLLRDKEKVGGWLVDRNLHTISEAWTETSPSMVGGDGGGGRGCWGKGRRRKGEESPRLTLSPFTRGRETILESTGAFVTPRSNVVGGVNEEEEEEEEIEEEIEEEVEVGR